MVDIYNVHIYRYIIMRKLAQRVILIAFSLSLVILISGVATKMARGKKINDSIASLPSFSFITLKKTVFHSSEIKRGPVLIVWFHPDCEHCQYEVSGIIKSDIPALLSKVLLIANDHPDSIDKFLEPFNYSDYPSIIAISDTSDLFCKIFGKDIVPSNYLYNKELKLVKILAGEVKTETIRKYLLTGE